MAEAAMAEAATAEFEGKFGMGGPWGHLLGKPYDVVDTGG